MHVYALLFLLAFRVKCPWHVYSPQMLLSPPVYPFPPSPQFSQPDTDTLYFPVIYSARPKGVGGGGGGGLRDTKAVSTIKTKKTTPWLLLKKKWTLGLGWAHTGLRVWPGLANNGILKSPVVWSGREKHCCFPFQSQTKLGNLGWVHLSPVPRLWHVCSPPIFYSVVASIANSTCVV